MLSIDKLLIERELSALRFALMFRLLLFSMASISQLFLGKSKFENVTTEIFAVLAIIACLLSLYYLRKKRFIRMIGIIGTIIDVVFITSQPIIWYLSVGGLNISPAYMIKGPMYQMYLWIMLIINSLAVQPIYVTVIIVGGSFGYIGHFAYLFITSVSSISNNFIEHNLGNQVALTFAFWPIFSFVIAGIAIIIYQKMMIKTIFDAVKNETVSNQLSRFFSPKIKEEIISQDYDLYYKNGRLQNIAVLFSDVRNFTAYCENKKPEEVMTFLHDYHGIMVDIIFKNDGSLDKFIGDGIMATFGVPTTSINDSDNALKTAIEMIHALKELNTKRINCGESKIHIGIGIHYGPAIVGNVGNENRLEYTVIGDTVNIASRLESSTKELCCDIIFSEMVKNNMTNDIKTKLVGELKIRGHEELMNVYTIVSE